MVYAFALAGLLAVTWLQTAPHLPPPWLWPLLLPVAMALAWRRLPRLAWGLLGIALLGGWCHLRSAQQLQYQLPAPLENRPLGFDAVIVDIPDLSPERSRVFVRLETTLPGLPHGSRLLLSDYGRGTARLPLHAGERWRFNARLRRPHGLLNPGTRDREAWLWAEGIRATGSVQQGRLLGRDGSLEARLAAVREALSLSIQDRLQGRPSAGMMAALVVGDGRAIPASQWDLFAATGVTHLVSISGLHITLVAGCAAALASLLWGRLPQGPLLLPTRRVAALAGIAAALLYSVLAGFSVPTQRTLFMLILIGVQLLWRQRPLLQTLAWSLVGVLLYDPFAVLSPGLWLSYAAVAAMATGAQGRLGHPHPVMEWMRAQWAVTLVLLPALIIGFGLFPWISPLANLLAIPLISGIVTPMALLGSLLPGPWLLSWAESLASGLLPVLEVCARLGVWTQAQAPATLGLAGLGGAMYAALPRGLPGRWLGLVLLLPLLCWRVQPPAEGEWTATIFDVGQGLAVLVQTREHTLLYDSGPDWPGDGDSATATLLPALRALDVRQLDVLMISHDDLDHSGGAESLIQALPTDTLLAQLPRDHRLWLRHQGRRSPCGAGQRWTWNGVEFHLFNPLPEHPAANDNDGSCVLRVDNGTTSLLLPGDIGGHREQLLVDRWGEGLRSTILIAPHHGSKSSSTLAFIGAVRPEAVVFSAGYRNRFRHPHPDTEDRYIGRRQLRSDRDGAIHIHGAATGWTLETQLQREDRFWRGRN